MCPQRKNSYRVIVRLNDDIYILDGEDAKGIGEIVLNAAEQNNAKVRHINREKMEMRKTFAEMQAVNRKVYKNYTEPKHARRLFE